MKAGSIGNNKLDGTNSNKLIYIGLLAGCLVCCLLILKTNYAIGALAACLPFILLATYYLFKKPAILFFIFLLVNYFIMGINRYGFIPVPITAIIDSLFGLLMIALIFKGSYERTSYKESLNPFTGVSLVWFLYCLAEILNNTSGSVNVAAWYQGVRSMAVYPLVTAMVVPLVMKRYRDIQWFLLLWAVLTILAAFKGYWQRSRGFDSYELAWLFGVGGRTHLINTGIRYFSFFTDAATFGASMGLSMVVFGIGILYCKKYWRKAIYLIAALGGMYGMIISGTRGSLIVPFAGLFLFVLISRNWKMVAGGILFIAMSLVFLKMTTLGDGNQFIRRMRTSFDLNDPSFQTRLINREALSKDMQNLPVGLGIGVSRENINAGNFYYDTATTPPDSWYVTIWTRTGIVGLYIYLGVLSFTILYGSYVLMFRVKNKELRGTLTGMLCGVFGVMLAAYGGDCYSQFPNGFLIYTCQTLVIISPYIDKKLTEEKEMNRNSSETEVLSV